MGRELTNWRVVVEVATGFLYGADEKTYRFCASQLKAQIERHCDLLENVSIEYDEVCSHCGTLWSIEVDYERDLNDLGLFCCPALDTDLKVHCSFSKFCLAQAAKPEDLLPPTVHAEANLEPTEPTQWAMTDEELRRDDRLYSKPEGATDGD